MSANAVLEIIIPIDVSNSLVIKKLRKIGVEVVGLNGIQIHPPEEKKPAENFAEELRSISDGVKNYQHEKNIDNWYADWSKNYVGKIKEKALGRAQQGFTDVENIEIPVDYPIKEFCGTKIENVYPEKVKEELEKTLGVKANVSCSWTVFMVHGATPNHFFYISLYW